MTCRGRAFDSWVYSHFFGSRAGELALMAALNLIETRENPLITLTLSDYYPPVRPYPSLRVLSLSLHPISPLPLNP